jgi:cyclic 2,3-diphosphoglycerate synthetase
MAAINMPAGMDVKEDILRFVERKELVCLVDGEHYPPVTKWTLELLAEVGCQVKGLVFVGGTEKVENVVEELGGENVAYEIYVPQATGEEDMLGQIVKALDELAPEIVIDLSDEPVLDYGSRFRIISRCLNRQVDYAGPDCVFTAPRMEQMLTKPSLAIIGTGKRVGKTAVGVTVGRILDKHGFDPVVVCMGRGGPPDPDYIDRSRLTMNADTLLRVADEGGHAASDYWEDALLGQVPTVGCRRCGGGMGGNPFASNVREGVRLVNDSSHKFAVMEGSGPTFPPVQTDARIAVVGAAQPVENILGYLGEYRLSISDLVIVTMCEEPAADKTKVQRIFNGIRQINPDCEIALTVLRPEPLKDVGGKKVFVATTARGEVADTIQRCLEEEYDCEVCGISTNLSNRTNLRQDLKAGLVDADILLTEVKAASIDVAARTAIEQDVEVVFLHNRPEVIGGTVGDLENAIVSLCRNARDIAGSR